MAHTDVAPLDRETIRKAPKALLHDHLDGGLRPATVLELAVCVTLLQSNVTCTGR